MWFDTNVQRSVKASLLESQEDKTGDSAAKKTWFDITNFAVSRHNFLIFKAEQVCFVCVYVGGGGGALAHYGSLTL